MFFGGSCSNSLSGSFPVSYSGLFRYWCFEYCFAIDTSDFHKVLVRVNPYRSGLGVLAFRRAYLFLVVLIPGVPSGIKQTKRVKDKG